LAISVGCPTVLLIADPGFAAELAEKLPTRCQMN
jgi:hypothetical protein